MLKKTYPGFRLEDGEFHSRFREEFSVFHACTELFCHVSLNLLDRHGSEIETM